jgi:hypothetical protein
VTGKLRKAMSTRKARVVGALALGVATVTAPIAASPAWAGTAPSCVDWWTTYGTVSVTFHVENDCSTTQRLKIQISYHVDSGCESVKSGYVWSYTVYNTASRIQNVVTC